MLLSSQYSNLANNIAGTEINLNNYTSLQNAYTTTTDGYIYVNNQAYTTQHIGVYVADKNNVTLASCHLHATANFQNNALYVKKGLKIYRADGSTNGAAVFNPLTSQK